MSNFLDIFPLPLVLATIIFVIIPTLVAGFLRHYLYRHLIDSANKVSRLVSLGEIRGRQPTIVDKLESRFREASQKIENVNTIALIDGLYSQEKLNFLNISRPCEQWGHFCQTLPNLLLGFGLLGNFCGISYNLYNLSQTLNQNTGDINNLVAQLQTPLQSMGVAFFTSLTAILCSSILIVINLRCNTNFAKALLISSLEDYLDNIFKVDIKGYSRLDKAVDRMVKQQHDFLTRFQDNVRGVLEESFGKAANQIVTANQGFQNNVDILVDRFSDVSNTMAASTDRFQAAIYDLEQQVKIVNQTIPKFANSANKLEISADRYLQAADKIEQSKFSEHLEQLTSDLASTQKSFSRSTAFLGNQVKGLVANHQEVTTLAKETYTNLQQASTTIQDSAIGFTEAAETFKETDFAHKLADATKQLVTVPQQFNQSAAILHQSTDTIATAIDNINNSSQQINNLIQQVNDLSQNSSKTLEKSDRNLQLQTTKFNNIQAELKQIVTQLQQHQESVNNSLQNFGGRVLNTFQEGSNNNIQEIQKLTQQFNSVLTGIGILSDRLITKIEDRSTKNIEENQNIITEFKQLTNQLNTIPLEINKLINSVEQKEINIDFKLNEINNQLLQETNQKMNIYIQSIQKLANNINKLPFPQQHIS